MEHIHWIEKYEGVGYNPSYSNTNHQNSRFHDRRHSLVVTVLDFCIIPPCSLPLEHFFLTTWIRIQLHILNKFCPPFCSIHVYAPSGKVYGTMPQYTVVHCSTERQNDRNTSAPLYGIVESGDRTVGSHSSLEPHFSHKQKRLGKLRWIYCSRTKILKFKCHL